MNDSDGVKKMDTLNRFFAMFDRVFDRTTWKAAFGDPQTYGERTVIPVASVGVGFGMGGGEGRPAGADEEKGEESEQPESPAAGGGGGGGGWSRPLALIEVTPARVRIKPIVHLEKVILAGFAMAAWCSFCWAVVAREHVRRGGCD